MYVVIDSNIWISELGLSTAKGLALQFFVRQHRGIIAIPEVVKREVEYNIRRALSEHCESIKKAHRQLLSVFGKLKEVVLPDEHAIDDRVAELFERISVERRDIPFSIESASQSFDKVIKGIPPSGPKNQQFKDGVIWADCLSLLEEDDVVLVSDDKGFFHQKEYANGLAANLQQEADQRPHCIRLLSSISELLDEIRAPVEVDVSALVREFCGETRHSFSRLLEGNGFEITGDPTVNLSSYITENVNRLYIEFEVIFRCNDITGGNRTQATLTLKGDATFETDDQVFSEFRGRGETLEFVDADGEQQRKNVYIAVGNIVIGHRTVEHTVRHRIE
jgi:hypothetical protein